MTVLAIKAVVAALREFPNFAASLDLANNEVVFKQYFHVGIAVDTERGLVVPVIRDAEKKSIRDLALEVASLAEKARTGKLSIDEMRGGTFTITNLGGIGGTAFSPIINYPEVAILGLSRSSIQPVFREKSVRPADDDAAVPDLRPPHHRRRRRRSVHDATRAIVLRPDSVVDGKLTPLPSTRDAMPIAVACPYLATGGPGQGRAGREEWCKKCPTCGELIPIPKDVRPPVPPPPMPARKKPADDDPDIIDVRRRALVDAEVVEEEPKPKPEPKSSGGRSVAKRALCGSVGMDRRDDEDDDRPSRSRRKVVDDDEDVEPRPKKRKSSEDDEDGNPPPKRRSFAADDEDEPRPRKAAGLRLYDDEPLPWKRNRRQGGPHRPDRIWPWSGAASSCSLS